MFVLAVAQCQVRKGITNKGAGLANEKCLGWSHDSWTLGE